MKPTNHNTQSNNDSTQPSHTSKLSRIGLTLTLTATLFCGLAVSTSAQNSGVGRIARERGFTIAPDVQTPIVLKTMADAACDLHAVGTSDTRSMRFYANGEGYVKIQATAREGMEGRVQLDCSSNGKAVGYPLHLRASSSPTSDMPAPQSVVPTPKGSTVRPALTEAQAQSLSDDELMNLGYTERPDVLSSPDQYAKWLDHVSRPMTVLPQHLVSTSVTASPALYTSANWSGLEAHSTTQHKYSAVTATWNVPLITFADSSGNPTYSAFWVGLDGDHVKGGDLVQAGTEQDAQEIIGLLFTNYYAWSELLPNQPTEQEVFGVNPGDDIQVEVWIGTGSGAPNPNGGYGSFRVIDWTQSNESKFYVPLNGTHYNGTEAEWIMERPTVGGSLPELAAYGTATMVNATALQVIGTKWVRCGTAANRNIRMYNGTDLLSKAIWGGIGSQVVTFDWHNFH